MPPSREAGAEADGALGRALGSPPVASRGPLPRLESVVRADSSGSATRAGRGAGETVAISLRLAEGATRWIYRGWAVLIMEVGVEE